MEILNDGLFKECYVYFINLVGILEYDEFLFYLIWIKLLVKNFKIDNEILKCFLLLCFLCMVLLLKFCKVYYIL